MSNIDNEAKELAIQKASLLASRGPHSTLFHLLFPVSLLLSFSVLYLMPLIVIRFIEEPDFAEYIRAYLKWCAPVVAVATLILYHKARRRMLAPYLRQVGEQE